MLTARVLGPDGRGAFFFVYTSPRSQRSSRPSACIPATPSSWRVEPALFGALFANSLLDRGGLWRCVSPSLGVLVLVLGGFAPGGLIGELVPAIALVPALVLNVFWPIYMQASAESSSDTTSCLVAGGMASLLSAVIGAIMGATEFMLIVLTTIATHSRAWR